MITRYAFFEGSVRDGQHDAFRQAVLDELLPTWQAFPGAVGLRVAFEVERDAGAPEIAMILEVDYPDRQSLELMLASPEREASHQATERVLPQYFEGRFHHHVTEMQAFPMA